MSWRKLLLAVAAAAVVAAAFVPTEASARWRGRGGWGWGGPAIGLGLGLGLAGAGYYGVLRRLPGLWLWLCTLRHMDTRRTDAGGVRCFTPRTAPALVASGSAASQPEHVPTTGRPENKNGKSPLSAGFLLRQRFEALRQMTCRSQRTIDKAHRHAEQPQDDRHFHSPIGVDAGSNSALSKNVPFAIPAGGVFLVLRSRARRSA